jgi:hypothetical protein
MPPAEYAKMGYLGRALARGARPFHYRAAVRTLLTGVGAVAPLHGAHLPLPGFTYAPSAPGFEQYGDAEFSGVTATTPAAVRTPTSPQTGSSAAAPPHRGRSEPVNEYGHRPPSTAPQPDAPRVEHQRFGTETKAESRSETQAVSIASRLIAIPEPKRGETAVLASAATSKVARPAPSAPPIANRDCRYDPIATVNPHPADRQLSRGPVEHAARPDTVPGPQPNLALRSAARQHARADLASESPGRSPSQPQTPPLVPSPNTHMVSLDRTAPGQRVSRPESVRPTMSAPTPTRASVDPTHHRALRTLEQLRHSVQALASRPQAAQPAAPTPVAPPSAPPAPKVVVVRPSTDRARRGAAFWERRYLGHPQLRVFR